jgi:hypothetical protein
MADYGRLSGIDLIVSGESDGGAGRLGGVGLVVSGENPSAHSRLEGVSLLSSGQNIGPHARLEGIYFIMSMGKTALSNESLLQGCIPSNRLNTQGSVRAYQGGKLSPDHWED